MTTLHEALSKLTVDQLKPRLKLLPNKPKSVRKADCIEAIKFGLTGKKLREFWQTLTQLQQQAVADACHSPDLTYHEARISAKYGECPPLEKKGDRWSYSGTPTNLALFFYPKKYQSGYIMPTDLAEALRTVAPKPAPLTIPTLNAPPDEQGIIQRDTEQDALRELPTILRLAEQGVIKSTPKTGMPTAACRKTLRSALSSGDFFPPEIAFIADKNSWDQEIGDIKPIAWIRLLLTGKLITSGSKTNLTRSGIKALSQPRHEVIRQLWNKWLTNNDFDEFNRIDEILGQKSKGHMTSKPPRREAIAEALGECPAQKWISLQDFSNFMQAEDIHFEISRDPWKLYLCDRQYGSFGYDGYGNWDTLQLRYILALLFEYAATLGLIDIAYIHPDQALADYRHQWGADDLQWLSRYDGLRAFRITKLGAYCLGLEKDYQETQRETSLRLEFSLNLTIKLLSKTIQPSETLLLETWAEPLTANTWRLDPLRARDAVERGNNTADFLAFLEKCDDQPMPQTIEAFLKTAQSNGQALKNLGPAHLFHCRDRQTTDMLLQQKALQDICSRCGETQLVVPDKHLKKFQKHIRSLGLGFA